MDVSFHLVKQLLQHGVNVVRAADITLPDNEIWTGEREKAPAAICRTVLKAKTSGKHLGLLKGGVHKNYDWIESQTEALACV